MLSTTTVTGTTHARVLHLRGGEDNVVRVLTSRRGLFWGEIQEGRFVEQELQAHRQNVMSWSVNKKVAKSKSSKDLNEPGKKVAKLKGLRDIDEQEWRRCIQKACNVVFHRLEINGNHLKRDNILARIEQFDIGDFNETPDKQLAACCMYPPESPSS